MINQLSHARLVYKVPSAYSKAKRHIIMKLCNNALTSILDEKNTWQMLGVNMGMG